MPEFKSLPLSVQEWAKKYGTEEQVMHPEPGLEAPLIAPDDLVSTLITSARAKALEKMAGHTPVKVSEVAVEAPAQRVPELLKKPMQIPEVGELSREDMIKALERHSMGHLPAQNPQAELMQHLHQNKTLSPEMSENFAQWQMENPGVADVQPSSKTAEAFANWLKQFK